MSGILLPPRYFTGKMDELYEYGILCDYPHQKMRVRPLPAPRQLHASTPAHPAHRTAIRARFGTAPMEDNSPPRSPSSAPLRNRPPSYLEQLHQGSPPHSLPYMELLRRGALKVEQRRAEQEKRAGRFDLPETPPGKLDPALRDALAALLAYTLASGRDRISSRDIFRRLRVPSHLEQSEGRAIAQCLKSLGWVRVHWGKDAPGQRVWGWRWREWNISHVKVDLKS